MKMTRTCQTSRQANGTTSRKECATKAGRKAAPNDQSKDEDLKDAVVSQELPPTTIDQTTGDSLASSEQQKIEQVAAEQVVETTEQTESTAELVTEAKDDAVVETKDENGDETKGESDGAIASQAIEKATDLSEADTNMPDHSSSSTDVETSDNENLKRPANSTEADEVQPKKLKTDE